ncbi:amino acid adenylation domain-containing protein [Pelagerythrobacter sp.]|uniref:amino acid adenylation domain-containing protein n=1 Tax=Pelagerythrobacter sp. TaxID=2800702 RepID=UPI0035AD8AEA
MIGTPRPLTEAQSGLWYSQALDPANPIFNTGQYIDLSGPLDAAAFQRAVEQASHEAEALALTFHAGENGPEQTLAGAAPRLVVIDLSDRPDPEGEALAAIRTAMETPVDLATGPIGFQTLYRLAPEQHLWAQQVHHLANDGFGMVMLTKRVAELYAAFREGKDGAGRPFASLTRLWEEDVAYRASEAREDDCAWWRDHLGGLDDIAGMAPGRAISAHRFLRHEQPMAEAARGAVAALAKASGASWPDVLTALVAAYCDRFVDGDGIVIGMPHMGRFGSAAARVPAMVMNVLPLHVVPDEDMPLAEWLRQASATMQEARRHGRYRSEQVRRDLGLIGGERRLHGPLVNVQPYDRPPRFAGLDATLHVTGTGPVEDIAFTFRGDLASAITLEVDANPDLYGDSEIAAHAARLETFLSAATDAVRLADIPTATPDEARREIEAFNATDHPLSDASLAELIERAMVAHPDAEAVRFEGRALTYAELDQRTAALAGQLRDRGVTAETIVAVALTRSLELVVALVAVLRAGGAYLPLDLEHPAARVAAILDSAAPAAVLADSDPHDLYGERLLRPADWGDTAPHDLPLPDHAAYVIYTSGSTGDPKGVVVTHRAIVNRLAWMGAHYGFNASDRILQKTPATFDVSVWEFFLPLTLGATLVVAPPGAHRDPAAIAALIRDEAITTLHFVPSMLAAFLDAPDSEGLSLARVFCSGEELPADLRDRFHRRIGAQLHNLYGPTEAAVDVSYWRAGLEDDARPVPIGWPVWNTRLLILDARMRPVPPGGAGELHLGGVQLARGYLGRDDLTAERFVPDPFHPGERLYRTGDLARRRADGAVIFLGRNDHQVKIRGLRIELGEIEAAIAASGLTRAATVQAVDGRIVAYVVSRDGFDEAALRDALAAHLPAYMVPAAFVPLDALPVTANGKLDRSALPVPAFASAGGSAPQGHDEERLAALYAEVLEIDGPIGREDDFFALGGDSLSAVRLMLRVAEEWGHDPGFGALFETPDIAGLAARIAAGPAIRDEGLAPLVTFARGDDNDLPPLFLIHPAGGIGWGYRTLASALSPRRTVHALQSPALDLANPLPDSIEALAADYAARIVEAHPRGPCHIGGWSVGGLIAQAVAAELEAQAREVGLVALLDAYPAECWRAEPQPTEAEALRALLAIAGYDPEGYPQLDTRTKVLAFLRAGDSALGNLPDAVQDGVIRTVLDTNRLVRAHYHRPFGGTLTHIRADADHAARPDLQADLWRPHCGALDAIGVPFLHPELPGAQASALIAPALSQRMLAHERIDA